MDKIYMPEDHMEQLYNSKNPLVRFFHRDRLNKIIKYINIERGRILDAGCGEGHLLREINNKFPNLKLYGVDVTKIAVKKAIRRVPQATIKLCSILKLDTIFEKSFFDVVICSEVLEHISNYKLVIDNLEKVTKKGGTIIISFPNEKLLTFCRFLVGRKPIKAPDHVNSLNSNIKNEFKTKLIKKDYYPYKIPICNIMVFKNE